MFPSGGGNKEEGQRPGSGGGGGGVKGGVAEWDDGPPGTLLLPPFLIPRSGGRDETTRGPEDRDAVDQSETKASPLDKSLMCVFMGLTSWPGVENEWNFYRIP